MRSDRFLRRLLTEFEKPGATFSLEHQSVEGDHGYILWTAEIADNVYELGTDTFVVRDSKIAVHSFAGKSRASGDRVSFQGSA